MLRTSVIALLAVAFVGTIVASTEAEARSGGGFGGGGFRGGGFGGGGFRGGGFGGGGFRGAAIGGFRGGAIGGVRSGFVARGPVIGGGRFVGPGIGRAAFVGPGFRRAGFVGPGFGRAAFVGNRFNQFPHRRFFFAGAPFVGAAYYAGYPYDYGYGYGYDDCLVRQPVWTAWGYQWRVVNVCY